MSDQMMRGVRVQLTTTMDSLLRTAVFEVMRIFESALYNHKMEMAHKGEEIAQLKIKLQTAELKLKESDQKKQSRAEANKSQAEPEVVPDVPEQPSAVPEIDVEVPDDWCAPLGYDTPNKKEEGFCPSVRLKQFSIRLSPVPLVKAEVANRTIDLQRSRGVRRSKRISTTSGPQTQSPVEEPAQASRPPKIGKDLKRLLQGLNEDYCNLKGLDRLRNRKTSQVNYAAKEEDEESPLQENEPKNHQASEPDATEPQRAKVVRKLKYSCKECYKVFDKKRGLDLHKRYQKTCKGCKMAFCFLNTAKCHTRNCKKYKALRKTNKCSAKTANEEKARSPSKKKKVKNGTAQFPVGDGKPSIQRFTCQHCGFKTKFPKKFKKHMRSHDDNNNDADKEILTCSVCQTWSGLKKELKTHMKSAHGVGPHLTDKEGESGRPKPLEDGEEGRGFSHSQ
ncbi:zinc finger protein 595 [Fundulus heteroclitus]|uniref:zinc finger protein 595 n=1 Tax=Fundulus heteroclitus TaxID=8078 RepID=UPI00165CC34B|nr:zinc finger protein 595 [Fundulus heteroclitus]